MGPLFAGTDVGMRSLVDAVAGAWGFAVGPNRVPCCVYSRPYAIEWQSPPAGKVRLEMKGKPPLCSDQSNRKHAPTAQFEFLLSGISLELIRCQLSARKCLLSLGGVRRQGPKDPVPLLVEPNPLRPKYTRYGKAECMVAPSLQGKSL